MDYKITPKNREHMFVSMRLDTPLGPMVAVADEVALYQLEFVDQGGVAMQGSAGRTKPLEDIERELELYFAGKLRVFKTALCGVGSPFQKIVWSELQKIPYGETRSYVAIAAALGKPSAARAVGGANGANPLAIIVPCHRVINNDGKLGGYDGGLVRKQWLLKHEGRGSA